MKARIDHSLVRQLAADGATPKEIAGRVNCSPSYARLILDGSAALVSERPGAALSRLSAKTLAGRAGRVPPFDHPAMMEGRTIYPDTVRAPAGDDVLKSAYNSAKIGKIITKGKWRRFPVYTLTLEERATCPRSCRHWRSCYGNGMRWAQRYTAGAALEGRLWREVHSLARLHPRGFAIRLHILGDFYSTEYVAMWGALLDALPALHAFGFSARWDARNDPIALALVRLVQDYWDRFAIRFSNAPIDECATISIEHPFQKPADAVICPQQIGRAAACATCALCWQSRRRIAFIQH